MNNKYIVSKSLASVLVCTPCTNSEEQLCIKPDCNVVSNLVTYELMRRLAIDLIPSTYYFVNNFEIVVKNKTHKIKTPSLVTPYYANVVTPPRMDTYLKQKKFGLNDFSVDDINKDVLRDINKLLLVDFILNLNDRNNDSFLFLKNGNCVAVDNDSMLGINYNVCVPHSSRNIAHESFTEIFSSFAYTNVFYYEIAQKYANTKNRYKILSDWLPVIEFFDKLTMSDFDEVLHTNDIDVDTIRLLATYINVDKPKIIKSFYQEYKYVIDMYT